MACFVDPGFLACRLKEAEARTGSRLNGQRNIFQHAEALQNRGDLERARKSQMNTIGHGETGNIAAIENHRTASLFRLPESWWINVVFPAPFGPISA